MGTKIITDIVRNGVDKASEKAGEKTGEGLVDILINTYIKPKIEAIAYRPKNYLVLVDLLAEYIKKCYENGKYMNTIVFRNDSKTVEELYVPLTLIKNGRKNEKIYISNTLNP